MKYSKIFPKTRREDPADVPSPGTRLLIRGGYILPVSGGVWVMTPLGLLARRQVERIVREEMERSGAIELELPILQPRDLWEETKRWDKYVATNTAFRLRDRKNAEFMLAPTAEELVTHFTRAAVQSHRDLPVTFWQMSPKFRDELRPRQGLIRGREFVMKDAYSFGANAEAMCQAYQNMATAYRRIFRRCGFNLIEVEADSGSIGGSGSTEFMAVTEYGEDVLLHCPVCNYGGNQEKASAYFPPYHDEALRDLTKLPTPNIRTVAELANAFSTRADQMVKTIVLVGDGKPVIVSMRGDLEVSEVKLANLLGVRDLTTADPETVKQVTGAPVGFAGPINLYGSTTVPYFFDRSVEGMRNFLCGANEEDVHFVNVNPTRDFPAISRYYDLSKAVAGQQCPNCKNALQEKRGIELGHIFQLQQVYSQPMNATFTSTDGINVPFWMGCYGIGVSRAVQAIVEQRNDEKGITWPWNLAPYQVVVIPVKLETHLADAEQIYHDLTARGIRVILDDREARIGEKLTDAELLGWPLQILVGRTWEHERKLEVRWRDPRTADIAVFTISAGKAPIATLSVDEVINLVTRLNHENK